MNIKELREYLDELEGTWNTKIMGEFGLCPVKMYVDVPGKLFVETVDVGLAFDYTSNEFVVLEEEIDNED